MTNGNILIAILNCQRASGSLALKHGLLETKTIHVNDFPPASHVSLPEMLFVCNQKQLEHPITITSATLLDPCKTTRVVLPPAPAPAWWLQSYPISYSYGGFHQWAYPEVMHVRRISFTNHP